MPEPLADHYSDLGLHPGADPAQLRAAYLRLMRRNHPDLWPADPIAAEAARRVNQAWTVLKDPRRKTIYDRLLASSPRPVERIHRMPASAARRAAYSPVGRAYRRDFHRACLRLGAAVFAVGLLLLTAVA
jgi:curved DNA-binding protein CbpA